MAKSTTTLLPSFAFGFLLLSFAAHNATGHPDCKWCVPNPSASTEQVAEALAWACGSEGHADCEPIQPGQPCYRQNDVMKTASYVFNDYYHRFKFRGGACDFKGAAILSDDNPTFDDCIIHCG